MTSPPCHQAATLVPYKHLHHHLQAPRLHITSLSPIALDPFSKCSWPPSLKSDQEGSSEVPKLKIEAKNHEKEALEVVTRRTNPKILFRPILAQELSLVDSDAKWSYIGNQSRKVLEKKGSDTRSGYNHFNFCFSADLRMRVWDHPPFETSTIAPVISSAAPVVETTLVASPTGLVTTVHHNNLSFYSSVTCPAQIPSTVTILNPTGRLFLLVDLTAPTLMGRTSLISSSSSSDSSPVHSSGLDASDQVHSESLTRDVSPRLCYPLRRAPRCSEGHFVVGLLLLFFFGSPPTTSEPSSGDSSKRPMHSSSHSVRPSRKRCRSLVDSRFKDSYSSEASIEEDTDIDPIDTGVDIELGIGDGDDLSTRMALLGHSQRICRLRDSDDDVRDYLHHMSKGTEKFRLIERLGHLGWENSKEEFLQVRRVMMILRERLRRLEVKVEMVEHRNGRNENPDENVRGDGHVDYENAPTRTSKKCQPLTLRERERVV
ncbi:hypothetical protein Tco_1505279 [Tanacetum coccineum]